MEAIVKVTNAEKKIAYFKLKEGQTITIGRKDGCNLTIKDDFLSGEHCTLRIENGHFVAKDLGSKNGTFLNESSLTENHVYIGDQIRIGDTILELAKEKMSASDVEHFTYNGEKRGTEFMSLSNLKNPLKGKEVKIELESSVRNNASHFADMRKKRLEKKKKNESENENTTVLGKIGNLLKKK